MGYVILFGVMIAGFILGLLLREQRVAIKRVEWLTRPVIFLLLFAMGVSIGVDDETMGNLLPIGLSSLGFAVLTIAGSMLLLALVLPFAGRGFDNKISPAAAAAIIAEAEHAGEVLLK